jgi:GNAT superfamily N-acetyltransferase
MNIRRAMPPDARHVREIALASTITRDSQKSIGMVEYPNLTEEEYAQRILLTPFFYIVEEGHVVIGFSSGYDNSTIDMQTFADDEIISHISKKERPFVYWDQLAFSKEHQGRGIGRKLGIHLINDVSSNGYRRIYSAVSHKPIRHKLSINLSRRLGFFPEEEIEVYNGLVFGIYRKTIE